MLAATDARRIEIERDTITAHIFVEITISGTKYRWVDTNFDVAVGSDTYSADNPVKGISLPQGSGAVDRDIMALELIDDAGTWRSRIGNKYIGIPVVVSTAFFQADNTFTALLTAYVGKSRIVNFRWDAEQGLITEINFTGPLTKLDSEYSAVTTSHNQAERDATDTCFAYAFAARDLKWGKK